MNMFDPKTAPEIIGRIAAAVNSLADDDGDPPADFQWVFVAQGGGAVTPWIHTSVDPQELPTYLHAVIDQADSDAVTSEHFDNATKARRIVDTLMLRLRAERKPE